MMRRRLLLAMWLAGSAISAPGCAHVRPYEREYLQDPIMSLEEEFSEDGKKIEISDEDAEKIQTVQDAVDYIKDLGVEDE